MTLFNIPFINGDYNDALSRLKKGEFMVAPSGPGLSTIDKDKKYWEALKGADFSIPDSGFMVILSRLFFGIKIKKFSGPKFFRKFINEKFLHEKGIIFSVDPNDYESKKNRQYLNDKRIPITSEYQYVAPIYDKNETTDSKLIRILESLEVRPKFLLLNLAVGV